VREIGARRSFGEVGIVMLGAVFVVVVKIREIEGIGVKRK